MSEHVSRSTGAARGTIRRRLLVNVLVDPDEARDRLPDGLHPHVTGGGTVVGCCLLDIEAIRPEPLPSVVGRSLRAAAHRISVEWADESGAPIVGVYVPVRHTDSRLAVAVGGRGFPGVHRRAEVDIVSSPDHLCWTSEPRGSTPFAIRVEASVMGDVQRSPDDEPVGGACLRATVGLSPDHRGLLEAARMVPDHRRARPVAIEQLESTYLSTFSTAVPAPSYLMADVGVTWTRATAPVLVGQEARA